MNQQSGLPLQPQTAGDSPVVATEPQGASEKSLASLNTRHGRTFTARTLWCFQNGIVTGLRTALWLLSIMVPVSLAVTILAWTGLLGWLAAPLDPIFGYLGLPGEAVVAFLTGIFLNIYSAIATLGSIPLTERQVTIFAMMALISHNFLVEATVQHKTGTPAWRTVSLRLTSSLLVGLVLNWILPASDVPAAIPQTTGATTALVPTLIIWATSTARLAGKVIAIIMGLMVLQRLLREFGIMQLLSIPLAPILWLMGLPQRTAFLWIVANVLGLAYGSSIILEEAKSGALTKDDAQLLNRSIAICHSLLEDTLLFVAIGAWGFWISVPRLAMAAGVVWFYRVAVLLVTKPTASETFSQ